MCVACDEDAEFVKRIVPPRYGGNDEMENLAALCEHHHEDFSHDFVDLLVPYEWHRVEGAEWRETALEVKEQLQNADSHPAIVSKLEGLLDQGQSGNPYPYIST